MTYHIKKTNFTKIKAPTTCYVGCLNEDGSVSMRDLSYMGTSSTSITNDWCKSYCLSNGFFFSANENGHELF